MTPDKHTNQELFLDVGNDHQLYVQDWGNPKAKTAIIYLHGGPGAGCNDGHKQPYDPATQRVIFFDQRGSGKSLPAGSIDHNTTNDLIDDISRIADKLKLEKFILHGRSWGSCLALSYAIQHPHKVAALVIGGIFLGTREELDFDEKGTRYDTFFPKAWRDFLDTVPKSERQAPMKYHLQRVVGSDPAAAKDSAYAYSQLILAVLRLDDRSRTLDYETFEATSLRIEAHYKLHHCFLEDNYILKHAASLTMPVWIVQGRYDVMCVPKVADELHRALPNSHLTYVAAGHAGSDRAIYDVARTVLTTLTGE
jgi:proline iminopeptidase